MNIKIIIQRLKSRWFPTEEDKIWKEWVDYKEREPKNLIELLNFNVRDGFKKRAIFLLLVPSAEFNPIYWKKEIGNFYHQNDFLKTLTPDLLSYAISLIVQFCTTFRPMHSEKPNNYAEGGGGITIFYSVSDKYHDALYFYNSCILTLLTIAPKERCERIFQLFSLQDVSSYWNMEDASGYNPFHNLLHSDIDELWKIKADAQMRQIITNELTGKTKPREDWEDALKCYADIINLCMYSEKPNYSTEMFADQIDFLVSEDHYGKKLISDWHVAKILKILSGDNYKELRHRITKFMVLGNEKKFSVWSNETLEGAEMMLTEFNQDREIAEMLQPAIEDYKNRSAASEQQKTNAGKIEAALMEKMK